jgi:hypothetical protein
MRPASENGAKRLLRATAEDRAWVLAQFSPEDQLLIVSRLRAFSEPRANGTRTDVAGAPATVKPTVGRVNPFEALEKADVAEMGALLEGEPDWLVALIVRDVRFPWVEDFMRTVSLERGQKIEQWVRLGKHAVKPEVVDTLLHLTNAMLKNRKKDVSVTGAFDAMLARLRQPRQVNEILDDHEGAS